MRSAARASIGQFQWFMRATRGARWLRRDTQCNKIDRRGPRSRPEAFLLQALVEVGDVLAVAVVELRRLALAGADELLGRLAPAWMRHLRIDVGPEPILGGLQLLPVARGPLIREGELHDRLD